MPGPYVLTDATVTVNTIALSTYVSSVTVTKEVENVDVTAMGSTSRESVGGLQVSSMDITFNNDETAAKTVVTLLAACGSGSNTVVVKSASGATTTFTLSKAFLASSSPVAGSVGDLSQQSVTFTGLLTVS